jgi:hypothetical protein
MVILYSWHFLNISRRHITVEQALSAFFYRYALKSAMDKTRNYSVLSNFFLTTEMRVSRFHDSSGNIEGGK